MGGQEDGLRIPGLIAPNRIKDIIKLISKTLFMMGGKIRTNAKRTMYECCQRITDGANASVLQISNYFKTVSLDHSTLTLKVGFGGYKHCQSCLNV